MGKELTYIKRRVFT